MFQGRSINLLDDRNEIEYVNLEVLTDRHLADNADPQIHIKLSEPLRPGWYRASARLSGNEVRNPILYLDTGFSYSQSMCLLLEENLKTGQFSALFSIPEDVHLVRFDPSDRECEFSIEQIEITPVSKPGLVMGLLPTAVRKFSDNPQRFLANLPTYIRKLRSPDFSRIVTELRTEDGIGYSNWLAKFDYNPDTHDEAVKETIASWSTHPLISVLTPVYNTSPELLEGLYRSLKNQLYENWEFCIADDASTKPHVRRVLERMADEDSRVKVVFREENGHISEASNSALELVEGDILTLADHDDLLHPLAFYHIAKRANSHPDWRIMYSDEDKIDKSNNRFDPYFKGDFNQDLFYCHNMMTHLIVYRPDDVRSVGGFRKGYEGSQDYDLALRILEKVRDGGKEIVHIPHILYHWRAIEGSIALGADQKSYAHERARQAINEHFKRIGSDAVSVAINDGSVHRVEYPVNEKKLFSIVICTRDRVDLLRTCVDSILQKSGDRNFEIVIIDNGSMETATLQYLEESAELYDNVKVVRDDGEFNFSRLNNLGVSHSSGDYLCLLNNDTEVIAEDWLNQFRMHLGRPEVGAVGAKLLYSDGTIQHAGITMGLGGLAAHSYSRQAADTTMNVGKAQLTQRVRAVTGACLATRRDVWDQLGGLDDEVFKVAYNDVDYCLKVWASGMIVIYEPKAELYHHESLSRGSDEAPEKIERFRREQRAMKQRWKSWTDDDLFFNPNLDYGSTEFRLSPSPRVSILD